MTKRYVLIRRSTGNTAGFAPTRAAARLRNQKANYALRIFDTVTDSFVR